MLIGLTGYAESGKDTVGRILVEKHGFTRLAFADAVKEMALVLNPVIWVNNNEIAKLLGTSYFGRHRELKEIVELIGWDRAKRLEQVRQYLQRLGTEAVRDIIGEHSWINALDKKVKALPASTDIVITDVRFPNEGTYVQTRHWQTGVCGYLVRVDRPGHDSGVSKSHASEAHITGLGANWIITNDRTLADLRESVDALVNVLRPASTSGIILRPAGGKHD